MRACIYIYIYIYISISLSLSLYIYIYIYINIGEVFHPMVYASLLPVFAGVAMASSSELRGAQITFKLPYNS